MSIKLHLPLLPSQPGLMVHITGSVTFGVVSLLLLLCGGTVCATVQPGEDWEGIVANAPSGTRITFDSGTYIGACDVEISRDIELVGAGPSATVIDCRGIARHFHVHSGANAVFNSLSFSNGRSESAGGCIFVNNANVSIQNSLFEGCWAGTLGGAIWSGDSALSLSLIHISEPTRPRLI
eukprot:2591047-Rhodomonas_salina.3